MAGRGLFYIVVTLVLSALNGEVAEAAELSNALARMYSDLSVSPPSATQMTVCYAFSCDRRWQLVFSPADRRRLTDLLAAGRATPAAERQAIAQAVAWFDRRVGPVLGTTKRVANADIRALDAAHNFDCVDATQNTSSLLLVTEIWGLLRHHAVGDPRSRSNILLGQRPHTTAIVTERRTKVDWAVDMWTHGYGQLPDVMPLERWQAAH